MQFSLNLKINQLILLYHINIKGAFLIHNLILPILEILVPEVESYLGGFMCYVKFHAQNLCSLGEISQKPRVENPLGS